ncbi:glyoxylase-like metal-dependent hydrolase (beta-lactamase superfamily II) [Anaerosolibacter carboniphilus]|uniref:Glyoxylase-like metal-dependent hydrolase (Beta-lactamase superfamily II) n=1 Tax=Anaerosolibacter carboniphilus TaxID=1417629 RepID=A0A841KUR6_9FIRM|nr:MBL fold metallo-hydrolase [Anaerosolibacter carboniphilus]MBB6217113.1 glyoxylase-like metal-dependent hydrolase (beta-lactamase superfamily II) [Anaerosolibacter carboniphilus]
MKFERFVVGMLESNSYIIYDEHTLDTFVIDPGDESQTLFKYIEKNALRVKAIILTHYHYDHIGAVDDIKKKYNCPVYIHKKDALGLKTPEINHSIGGYRKPVAITADKLVSDGDQIQAGEVILEVIHTPGHTHGSMCLKVKNENIIFTGDTIFDDDLGRTDLEDGSEDEMKRSIVNKIAKWADDIVIYPGHADHATMAYVRKKNIEFLSMLK